MPYLICYNSGGKGVKLPIDLIWKGVQTVPHLKKIGLACTSAPLEVMRLLRRQHAHVTWPSLEIGLLTPRKVRKHSASVL